jgi:hypothetical protein
MTWTFTRTASVLFLAALSTPALAQYGPAPSWVLTEGAPATCTDDDVFLPNVYVNVPAPDFASEKGVLSAPGFPNLGYTQDNSFQGVGVFGFTAFTDPFVLPANTPLTLFVETFHEPNQLGGVAYRSYITWDCTTGETLAIGEGAPQSLIEVPTLSGAGLATLALALAALAIVVLRRRLAAPR